MTYYAHSIYKYNTEIEKYELSLIPDEVINPNGNVDQTKCEKEIMRDCYKLIDKCDCLVFSSVDGVLGRGVANEITYAFVRGIPIYYLHSNKLIPIKTISMKRIENSTTQRLYVTFEYEVKSE